MAVAARLPIGALSHRPPQPDAPRGWVPPPPGLAEPTSGYQPPLLWAPQSKAATSPPPGVFQQQQQEVAAQSVVPDSDVVFYHDMPEHLLDRKLRAKKYDKAINWFYKMQARGHIPDRAIYNRMLAAAAVLGTFADASFWLRGMKQSGIAPNLLTYNCFMSACAISHQKQDAQKCMAEMKKAGVAPDADTYSLLIAACARSNDPDSACRWLREMVTSVGPNEAAYAGVVEAFASASKVDSAMVWLDEMRAKGFEPGLSTTCRVLTAAASCSPPRADVAEAVVLAMRRAGLAVSREARKEAARAVGKVRLVEILTEPVLPTLKAKCFRRTGSEDDLKVPSRPSTGGSADKDRAGSGDDDCRAGSKCSTASTACLSHTGSKCSTGSEWSTSSGSSHEDVRRASKSSTASFLSRQSSFEEEEARAASKGSAASWSRQASLEDGRASFEEFRGAALPALPKLAGPLLSRPPGL